MTVRMLLAEIGFRKVNFVLSAFAVIVAVTLFVAGPMLVEAYQRETQHQVGRWRSQVEELEDRVGQMRRGIEKVEAETTQELARLESETRKLMRDMGFNLMIVHHDTNMSDFWAADFAAHDMPQEYVDRLAGDARLTLITHLVATLQQRIEWEHRKVLLVGYLPEATQSHLRKKAPMGYNIKPGTVLLGYELGVGRKAGEKIDVLGKEFEIAHVLPEQGSKKDITIAMHLDDAQAVLNKPGRINQIMALGCRCANSNLPDIRKQLAEILPQTRVTEFRSIALARAEQRKLVEVKQKGILAQMQANLRERQKILQERKAILAEMATSRARIEHLMVTLADVMTPLVVLAAAVWVGLLAWSNVRERRTEIGLLRALGKGSSTIVALLLGKAVMLGLVGGLLGFFLGTFVGRLLGQLALGVAANSFAVRGDVLVYTLLGAPLLSALASYLPTLSAVLQDPAVVLREP